VDRVASKLGLGPEGLLVSLLLLHQVALAVGPEAWWGRGVWVAQVGLFILWQPFFEPARRISVGSLLLILGGVALATLVLNDWLLIFWTGILASLVGGRVLFVRARRQRLFLLLAFAYLLGGLLSWQVPQVVPEELRVGASLAPVFHYVLPCLLAVLLVWPKTLESGPPLRVELVDFIYSLFVLLLLAVLVLGSLAFMLLDRAPYGVAVASTVLVMAALLLLLAWAWNPRGGFSGFGVLFSRYVLSVALPFEQWMRRLTHHAEFEPDPEQFLHRTLEEMLALPWVTGGCWYAEHRQGQFGRARGGGEYQQRFDCPPLVLTLDTQHKLSPALMLHFQLLVRLLAEFYLAKLRGRALQQMSYVQAVHETGARLTHDVKNLLQSLTNLCHAAESAGMEGGDMAGFQSLMQRQLPLVTQRLRQTLDKLEQRQDGGESEMVSIALWWDELQLRYGGESIRFAPLPAGVEESLPAAMFDVVAENLLQNTLLKRQREAAVTIAVELSVLAGGQAVLSVVDTGSAVPGHLAPELGKAPVASRQGLGIGLYQSGRMAAQEGYGLVLAENQPGAVRFVLAPLSPAGNRE